MPNIKLFESKKIRSVWSESDQKLYFVIENVAAITYSSYPKQYAKKMKLGDSELAKGRVQFVPPLKMIAADRTYCVPTALIVLENRFPRYILSLPGHIK